MQFSDQDQAIINNFHRLYYNSHFPRLCYNNSEIARNEIYWLGTKIWKCPLDLWIYQEIIYETKPDIIVECGTAFGGSAFYMASICDLVNRGSILTIDVEPSEGKPQHERVTYLVGSSIAPETIAQLRKFIPDKSRIMVILNSDHSKPHVIEELRIYSKLVTEGCYLIVEDTNINGHPVLPEYGDGPMEALEEFLIDNDEFIIDMDRQKLFLTMNPKGYLKKVRGKNSQWRAECAPNDVYDCLS